MVDDGSASKGWKQMAKGFIHVVSPQRLELGPPWKEDEDTLHHLVSVLIGRKEVTPDLWIS